MHSRVCFHCSELTSERYLNLSADTGSSDLWVPSKYCSKKPSNTCKHFHKYDHSLSSTYQRTNVVFRDRYADNTSAQGFWGIDDILIGTMKVKKQYFAEATFTTSDRTEEFDGILGLSLQPHFASVDYPKTVFQNMIDKGLLKAPVFSFYLSRNIQSDSRSQLIFGGVDGNFHKGDFVFKPVQPNHNSFWKFTFGPIVLENFGHKFCRNECVAVADSGTSYILGPPRTIALINEVIGAYFVATYKLYMFDCRNEAENQNVVFTIGKKRFKFEPSHYIVKIRFGKDELCISGFQSLGEEPSSGFDFILGDVFHRHVYVAYDVGNTRIGFAEAV